MNKDLDLLLDVYSSKHPSDSLLKELATNVPEALAVIREEAHAAIQRIREKVDERVRQALVEYIRNSK